MPPCEVVCRVEGMWSGTKSSVVSRELSGRSCLAKISLWVARASFYHPPPGFSSPPQIDTSINPFTQSPFHNSRKGRDDPPPLRPTSPPPTPPKSFWSIKLSFFTVNASVRSCRGLDGRWSGVRARPKFVSLNSPRGRHPPPFTPTRPPGRAPHGPRGDDPRHAVLRHQLLPLQRECQARPGPRPTRPTKLSIFGV